MYNGGPECPKGTYTFIYHLGQAFTIMLEDLLCQDPDGDLVEYQLMERVAGIEQPLTWPAWNPATKSLSGNPVD